MHITCMIIFKRLQIEGAISVRFFMRHPVLPTNMTKEVLICKISNNPATHGIERNPPLKSGQNIKGMCSKLKKTTLLRNYYLSFALSFKINCISLFHQVSPLQSNCVDQKWNFPAMSQVDLSVSLKLIMIILTLILNQTTVIARIS